MAQGLSTGGPGDQGESSLGGREGRKPPGAHLRQRRGNRTQTYTAKDSAAKGNRERGEQLEKRRTLKAIFWLGFVLVRRLDGRPRSTQHHEAPSRRGAAHGSGGPGRAGAPDRADEADHALQVPGKSSSDCLSLLVKQEARAQQLRERRGSGGSEERGQETLLGVRAARGPRTGLLAALSLTGVSRASAQTAAGLFPQSSCHSIPQTCSNKAAGRGC